MLRDLVMLRSSLLSFSPSVSCLILCLVFLDSLILVYISEKNNSSCAGTFAGLFKAARHSTGVGNYYTSDTL